jgi:hypothetical protein
LKIRKRYWQEKFENNWTGRPEEMAAKDPEV